MMHPPRRELAPEHLHIVSDPAEPGPVEPDAPRGAITESCTG